VSTHDDLMTMRRPRGLLVRSQHTDVDRLAIVDYFRGSPNNVATLYGGSRGDGRLLPEQGAARWSALVDQVADGPQLFRPPSAGYA
jgi:hypothetical protein